MGLDGGGSNFYVYIFIFWPSNLIDPLLHCWRERERKKEREEKRKGEKKERESFIHVVGREWSKAR